ncbi:MAG: hypothetical protein NTW32_26330 [Chloroflexi bacterium]|nr:hypothetical protein [Chloroflexota bacterium]
MDEKYYFPFSSKNKLEFFQMPIAGSIFDICSWIGQKTRKYKFWWFGDTIYLLKGVGGPETVNFSEKIMIVFSVQRVTGDPENDTHNPNSRSIVEVGFSPEYKDLAQSILLSLSSDFGSNWQVDKPQEPVELDQIPKRKRELDALCIKYVNRGYMPKAYTKEEFLSENQVTWVSVSQFKNALRDACSWGVIGRDEKTGRFIPKIGT